MGGEHWSSSSGKALDKHKDQYVRIVWDTPGEKPLKTIITKEELARDSELEKALLEYRVGATKPVKVKTKTRKKDKDKTITFEFYNWEKPDTEEEVTIQYKTILNLPIQLKLDALKTLGKNPTFTPTITCGSTDKCRSFSPAKGKALNCAHIALRFQTVIHKLKRGGKVTLAPEVYCKRAHPQTLILPSEQDLDWNVSTAGTAIMLQRFEDTMKTLKKKLAEDPVAKEKARQEFKAYMEGFAKKVGLKETKPNERTTAA